MAFHPGTGRVIFDILKTEGEFRPNLMASNQSFFNNSLQMRDASQQKRKKARSRVSLAGEYRIEGKNDPVECQIVDLGTGGVSMMTKATMYVGDRIRIRMRLGPSPLDVAGVVIRVSGKTLGIQFEKVSEEQMALIQQYIHQAFFDKDHGKKTG